MFVPDDQRGGGEGGGRIVTVTLIPVPAHVPYKGSGDHKVLLVKRLALKSVCRCYSVTPFDAASEVISKVAQLQEGFVRAELAKAGPENPSRISLKTGEGSYIESLVVILSELFCPKEFIFSSEKIN
jgi:hypothetical protein